MTIEGVDYSFARPSPAGLRAAGKQFAVRYGGPGTGDKHLHADELRALVAAGLSVVANAEGQASGYRGEAAGRAWATAAEAHFRSLGMPADRPIYFSADWDASPADWADIDAALQGSAAVIGAARVGVYGSYDVIAHCSAAKTANWFWQTYAWSHGKWHSAAHLQQYRNNVTVAGGACDLNRATVADYGQWGLAGRPATEEALPEFQSWQLEPGYAFDRDGRLIDRSKVLVAAIPPVSAGRLPWGPAWVSFGCDFGQVSLRVAVQADDTKDDWDVYTVDVDGAKGRTATSRSLPKGAGKISVGRIRRSDDPAGDQVPVSMLVEVGHRR